VKEALLALSPSELRAIASALRIGSVAPPYSPLALTQLLGQALAQAAATSLQQMANAGTPPAGIIQTLDLLAAAIAERPRLAELVDVVTTGPELSGTANRDTGVVVSDLFRKAEQSVIIAGYAVYQGQKVFQALAERMAERPALKVRLYLDISRRPGDTTISAQLVQRFCRQFEESQWPAGKAIPEIYYDPRAVEIDRKKAAILHAKCVVIDGESVFVSSANFTEAAQQKNIEIGLLLKSEAVAERITRFLDSLVGASRLVRAI
jgi:phosphatidylserine/phosphatidylglycerophosphate/cardiolipin synthase-like enzyme